MGISDDEWLAAARARFAREGHWEPLRAPGPAPDEGPSTNTAPPGLPACPFCVQPPALEVLRTESAGMGSLLRWCPRCCGIWAPRAALSDVIAPPDDPQPAFTAGFFPPRCRGCGAALRPDGSCTKCRVTPAPLSCPECRVEMKRTALGGVTVDVCPGCAGVWFDAGELVRVYGVALQPPTPVTAPEAEITPGGVAMDALAIGANILLRLL